MDDIADYEEDDIADKEDVDEDLPGEVSNFNGEDADYVNFLDIENILNFPHNDYGEFYTDEEIYMFTRESVTSPFLSIFMARGREKERQKKGNSGVLPSGVWGFLNKNRGTSMMRHITLILGCSLVLSLRNGEWNELIGHPKNSGKDNSNSGRFLSNLWRIM